LLQTPAPLRRNQVLSMPHADIGTHTALLRNPDVNLFDLYLRLSG
jgi:hypothetical protein